ncbi:MAG: hypothetical protein JNM93_02855 [Bacteriovoracaceae bacterium]|nr:hypothetical protein [Bacteriovoracaceae bacterium]
MTDKNDEATIVVDIKALKAAQAEPKNHDLTSHNVSLSDLSFAINNDETKVQTISAEKYNFPVICFDFTDNFFQKNIQYFPKEFRYTVTNELPKINHFLQKNEFKILFLYYPANPNLINQIIPQVKKKFPFCKVVLVANALDPEKVKIHAASAGGAHEYLKFPLTEVVIREAILKLHSKK